MGKKVHQFGKNEEYLLDERALRHILDGNFVVRSITDINGKKTTEEVLSGGLHTLSGWSSFLAKHPGVVHLLDYDPEVNDEWYFARELQNGVITLKIPRKLFSKDAASITMMPDIHYKSGYLWKTLFPQTYTEEDILDVIGQALINIDVEESEIGDKQSLIIGFARTMEPFSAIRIRFQLEGKNIRSAFPTWDQPHTGNNGKPYSHEHSISFHIAESTVGNINRQNLKTRSHLFSKRGFFEFYNLINLTPLFLLRRTTPEYGQIQDEWHEQRKAEIRQYIQGVSDAELDAIEGYLFDFCISKEAFFLQCKIYETEQELLDKYPGFLNVAAMMQNLCDCMYALFCSDNLKTERRFLSAMQRFLSMSVIHAGGMNTIEGKRLFHLMSQCASEHHAEDSIKIFIEALAVSPMRSAVYNEFNVNTFVKKNNDEGLAYIGYSGVRMAFTREHLVEFIAITLGENYLLNFSREVRLKMADILVSENYSSNLIRDSLAYFRGEDFDFFAEKLYLIESFVGNKVLPAEDAFISVMRDYCRMLITYRLRIVLEDPDAYQADPFDYEYGSTEMFELTKQKHKRMFIVLMHQMALESMAKFSAKVGYQKLEKRCQSLLKVMTKEQIPTPKHIPNYIPSWEQDPKYRKFPKDDFSFLRRD